MVNEELWELLEIPPATVMKEMLKEMINQNTFPINRGDLIAFIELVDEETYVNSVNKELKKLIKTDRDIQIYKEVRERIAQGYPKHTNDGGAYDIGLRYNTSNKNVEKIYREVSIFRRARNR